MYASLTAILPMRSHQCILRQAELLASIFPGEHSADPPEVHLPAHELINKEDPSEASYLY